MTAKLALLGGPAVWDGGWPAWPQPAEGALAALEAVLHSGRWSLSGPSRGTEARERQWARAWAQYVGARFSVPTASGTAALMIALEACGVGAGDEVIIPGVSWAANVSTVLGVNAVPVFADVDPETYCMDPQALEAAITPRTKAIVVVHLYSALADLERLSGIARAHGIPLIEDAAQAHGARYGTRCVGTVGDVGMFSMHHSKLLTSGEGGATVTDDPVLAHRMELLRIDGRAHRVGVQAGEMEVAVTDELMGSNRCMSEFQAALLLEQLPMLERQGRIRAENAARLDTLLERAGHRPQRTARQTTERAYYAYCVSIDPALLDEIDLARFSRALSAELGFAVKPPYPPLYRTPLYNPRSRRRFAVTDEYLERLQQPPAPLPVSEAMQTTVLNFHHSALLAPTEQVDAIADAFAKVVENLGELRGWEPEAQAASGSGVLVPA